MPKKSSPAPKRASLLILAMMGFGVVAGLAAYVKLVPADKVPQQEHRVETQDIEAPTASAGRAKPTTRQSSTQESPQKQDQGTYVYDPVYGRDQLKFEPRKLSVPEGTDPKVFAVNEYLQDTKVADPQARLLSVDLHDGVAAMYFNEAFNQSQGTDDEAILIKGIQMAMGQFPEVQKIQFFVNAKPLDTLGNVELNEPIPVIRPAGVQASKQTAKRSTSEER